MDREMFRRMAVEWIREVRRTPLMRLLGTFYRSSTDGDDPSPR
jgi:hypothetical protein